MGPIMTAPAQEAKQRESRAAKTILEVDLLGWSMRLKVPHFFRGFYASIEFPILGHSRIHQLADNLDT
jgi:hypothetical protein